VMVKAVGVLRSVASESAPNDSALDSKPSDSMVDSVKPAFSAVQGRKVSEPHVAV
jgi:hypothetical protein